MIELIAIPALIALGAGALELAAKFDLVPTMARVRLFGQEFTATVLKDNGDGTYQMQAKQHTARTAVGTEFTAKKAEITEMAAAEMPGAVPIGATAALANMAALSATTDDGAAGLDMAMAEERKTITPVAEIIAAFRKDKGIEPAPAPTATGVSVPPGPTAAPLPAPNPPGSAPMTHLADKMKQLATGTSGFAAALEKKVDDALAAHAATQGAILKGVDEAFAKVDAVNADAKAGLAAITDELSQLSNE